MSEQNMRHQSVMKIQGKQSSVSELFFSKYNINILQDAIRYRVYVESEKRLLIGKQSEDELIIIMRSIYLTDARNIEGPKNVIVNQVRTLNSLVLDYCVPQIVREGESYIQYIHDASSIPVPLDRGQIATTKGYNSLDMSRLYKF